MHPSPNRLTTLRNGQLPKAEYIAAMHELHRALFEYAEYLPLSGIAAIEIHDGQVIMTARENGVKLVCDPEDQRLTPVEMLNFGGYEPETTEMLRLLTVEAKVILDVGGNVGWYSISLAKTNPGAIIHAFEPIERTYAMLHTNLALNGVTEQVTAHNFGLAEKEEILTFNYTPTGSGGTTIGTVEGDAALEKITCPVRRMDDFVVENGLTVDFIKCDVEGAELFVLRGGEQTLRRDQPAILAEMLRKWAARCGYHPNEMMEYLNGLGYDCFTAEAGHLVPFRIMTEDTLETNFFFLHRERHAEVITRLAG